MTIESMMPAFEAYLKWASSSLFDKYRCHIRYGLSVHELVDKHYGIIGYIQLKRMRFYAVVYSNNDDITTKAIYQRIEEYHKASNTSCKMCDIVIIKRITDISDDRYPNHICSLFRFGFMLHICAVLDKEPRETIDVESMHLGMIQCSGPDLIPLFYDKRNTPIINPKADHKGARTYYVFPGDAYQLIWLSRIGVEHIREWCIQIPKKEYDRLIKIYNPSSKLSEQQLDAHNDSVVISTDSLL